MKRFLVDSDVILDVLLERPPFYTHSSKVLSLCESKSIQGFITPVICANLYYIVRRKTGHQKAKEILQSLLQFIKALPQNEETIQLAIESDFSDFEDALQHFASIQYEKIDGIITRNIRDFNSEKLKVLTPQDFLSSL